MAKLSDITRKRQATEENTTLSLSELLGRDYDAAKGTHTASALNWSNNLRTTGMMAGMPLMTLIGAINEQFPNSLYPIAAGAQSGLTVGQFTPPGYAYTRNEYPWQAVPGEVAGFIGGMQPVKAGLAKLGLPKLIGKGAGLVSKASPGLADVLAGAVSEGAAFSGLEGTWTGLRQAHEGKFDPEELGEAIGHGFRAGVTFGGTGAGVAQLPRLFTEGGQGGAGGFESGPCGECASTGGGGVCQREDERRGR